MSDSSDKSSELTDHAEAHALTVKSPESNAVPEVRPAKRPSFAEAARVVALHMAKRSNKPADEVQRLFNGTRLQHRGPSLIISRLYLGDFLDASDENIINSLGVTHILSVVEFEPASLPSRLGERKIQKLHISLKDVPRSNIHTHFEKTTKWISDALEDPSAVVLVHCFQGISRSATLVAAYLLSTTGHYSSAREVLDFLQEKRSIVQPNSGFQDQLEKHAAACMQLRCARLQADYCYPRLKWRKRMMIL